MNDNMALVGTWGRYFGGSQSDFIYPLDRGRFKTDWVVGKVFFCSAVTPDGYLSLTYGREMIRVWPDGYQTVADILYPVGTPVRIKEQPERMALIRGIGWHDVNHCEIYFLTVDGKKKARRYWREDLEGVTKP